MKTYICTTGTSIANGPIRDLSVKEYIKKIDEKIDVGKSKNDTIKFLKFISAETNSLQALKPKNDDKIYLLHSETDDGKICAEKIKELIKKYFHVQTYLVEIKGLQVKNAYKFKSEGLKSLFDELDRIVNNNTNSEIILNITGGFKSVPPYITLYGMLKQLKTAYLFEFSDSLIKLPPLPLNYDAHILEKAMAALIILEKETSLPENDFYSLIQNLEYHERENYASLIEDCGNGNITISAFGLMLLDYNDSGGTVFLSKNASKTFSGSNAQIKNSYDSALKNISKSIWRNSKIHTFRKTDLDTIKLPGDNSIRIAFFLEGKNIYVCELFSDHNEYERTLGNKKIKDYPKNSFNIWQELEHEISHSYNPEFDEIIELNDEIDNLKTQINESYGLTDEYIKENDEYKAKLLTFELKITQLNNKIIQKEKIIDELNCKNEKLKIEMLDAIPKGLKGLFTAFKNLF